MLGHLVSKSGWWSSWRCGKLAIKIKAAPLDAEIDWFVFQKIIRGHYFKRKPIEAVFCVGKYGAIL